MDKHPSQGRVQGIDYARFGTRGRPLSDLQIEKYILQGRYGEAERDRFWAVILRGGYRRLDKRIRRGDFGQALAQELNRKRPVGKRTSSSTSRVVRTEDLLDDFM